jgi:acetate---CoA ligase (ADP-forming)
MKSAVIVFPGINRERDMARALDLASGQAPIMVWHKETALPPVDAFRARRLVDGLALRRLLDGVRARPAADLDAVVAAIVSLSGLVEDLGDHLEALDVNPLLAGPAGCVAVDALVLPRTAGPARPPVTADAAPRRA